MRRIAGHGALAAAAIDDRPLTPMDPIADEAPPATAPPWLHASGIGMSFPGVRALDGVDLAVAPGDVHAIVGENGAGKSTLIKILSGGLVGFDGRLVLDGRPVRFASPREAMAHGIAVIPQELLLVGPLSASENICLGHEPRTGLGLLDRDAVRARGTDALTALDAPALLDVTVHDLDPGRRQIVAIARALSLDARLVIMDEPTASLGPDDVARLERIVGQLSRRGVAVVYVSHRLDEVRRVARRITVLRDGRQVATVTAGDVSDRDLVRLMVGRDFVRPSFAPVPAGAGELLRVEHLSLADPDHPTGHRLRDVSLSVARGEIVGLAGLVGAGRTDLLLALIGASDRRPTGSITVADQPYVPSTPAEARARGLVLVPEERAAQGIFPRRSLAENITAGAVDRVARGGFIERTREATAVERLILQTRLRAVTSRVPIATLSGGNQQKAILARCLFASPTLLLLDEPTRGIDLAAKADIYDQIRDLARRGFGVLLCSSELPELLTLCHRVLVVRDGRIVAQFGHEDATEERILDAAAGAESTPAPSTTAAGAREPAGPPTDASRPSDSPGSPGAPAPPGASPRRRTLWRGAPYFGLAAVVLLAVIFSPVRGGRPVFLAPGNLTDVLRQVAEKGILAAGMTPVILSGGIDLSVGSVLALTATSASALMMQQGMGLAGTLVLVLALGVFVGAANGVMIARWRIQPFIVTLAMMSAARGVARYVSGGAAIPLAYGPAAAPEGFRWLGGHLAGIVPVPALLFLAAVAGLHVFLTRTPGGRQVYAVGDNEPAARLAGIRVARQLTWVYAVSGGLAALAGLVHAAQLEQGNPNDGVAYELDAIAAVVIGGTNLAGGVGTVTGTLVGTLIIGVINNSMGLNNIDANLQLILKGALILGAVWLQRRRG